MAHPTVRVLRQDELATAADVVNHAMLGPVNDEAASGWAKIIDAERSHGAFAPDGRIVGLARYFPTDLTIPGGQVAAAGVTAVGVLSTHRRQGHLTRLMEAQLQQVRGEGVPVALLVAAEWPIYGRFGYGPAVDGCTIHLDTATARFRAEPTGSIEIVDLPTLRIHLEAAYELWRARTPGGMRRDALVLDSLAGLSSWPGRPHDSSFRRGAVWRDGDGAVLGAVSFKVDDAWHRSRPAGTAEVSILVGATTEAERELWRFLCHLDWIRTVTAGVRGVDDPLPLLLEDGRAAHRIDQGDFVWARILDVPGAFAARRSPQPASAIVEVIDPLGFASGRWQISLGPDGSEVAASTAEPDVTLPVGSLGAAYLGGRSVRRLFEAGWLEERTAGGVDRLAALLHTNSAPWTALGF